MSIKNINEFDWVIATTNAYGYLLATVGPTFIDPLLTTHMAYGARNYQYAYLIWPIAFAVFILTLLARRAFNSSSIFINLAPFILCSILSLPIFYPEVPHLNVVGVTIVWCIITTFWLFNRKYLSDILLNSDSSKTISIKTSNIAVLKDKLLFTKYLFAIEVVIAISYLSALSVIGFKFNKELASVRREIFLLNMNLFIAECSYALYIVLGPIRELFLKYNSLNICLQNIIDTPEVAVHNSNTISVNDNKSNNVIEIDNSDTEGVHPIANTNNASRIADIVFVHGLNGKSHSTWRYGKKGEDGHFFWPEKLGNDLQNCGIWSLGYEAGITHWFGSPGMAIQDRARNLVLKLLNHKIGKRPLIFISHSLGGLEVKEIIVRSQTCGSVEWKQLVSAIRGVVFCGTPHRGAHLATAAKVLSSYLRTQEHLQQIEMGSSLLDTLHNEFLEWQRDTGVMVESYVEKTSLFRTRLLLRPLPLGLVVPPESGNPGIAGSACHPISADHVTLVKPDKDTHDVYAGVLRFIEKALTTTSAPMPVVQGVIEAVHNENRVTKVTIISPLAGESQPHAVHMRGEVENLPTDKELWIVKEPHSGSFHPDTGPIMVQNGKWIGTAFIGNHAKNADTGQSFMIHIVQTNKDTSNKFKEYLTNAHESGGWVGLPTIFDGEKVASVVVVRDDSITDSKETTNHRNKELINDMKVIGKIFNEITSLRELDYFIDQALYPYLLNSVLEQHDCLERYLQSSFYHVFDNKLGELINSFYISWSDVCQYWQSFTPTNVPDKLRPNTVMDMATTEDVATAIEKVPEAAKVMHKSLQELLKYIRNTYRELDL